MRHPALALTVIAGLTVSGLSARAETVRVFANTAHQIAFQGKGGTSPTNLQTAFEKKTGIKIVWETIPYPEMRQSLLRALAASNPQYDVVMVENSWASPAVLDRLASVSTIAGTAGMKDLDGIFPGMRSEFTLNGDLKAVPIRSNPQIVHYNKAIFARRGLGVPKTFDELLTDAKRASYTRSDGAKVYGLALKPNEDLITIVKALGGDVLSPDYKIGVDSPATIAAIGRIKTLYGKGAIPPNFETMNASSVQTLMKQGLAAMTFFGDNYYNRFNNPKQSQISGHAGFFAIPGAKAGEYAPAKVAFWGAGMPVNASAKSHAAAWKFIEYLASAPVQLQMAVNGNGPVRGSVLDNPKFTANAPYAPDTKIALSHASPLLPVFDGTAQVSDAFEQAAVAAITGKTPVAKAMAEARKKIAAIVAAKRSK